MADYDTQSVTGVACAQWDGSNDADIAAICPDARFDPTQERVAKIPSTHGRTRLAYKGDWVLSLVAHEYLVLPDDTFLALFTASA